VWYHCYPTSYKILSLLVLCSFIFFGIYREKQLMLSKHQVWLGCFSFCLKSLFQWYPESKQFIRHVCISVNSTNSRCFWTRCYWTPVYANELQNLNQNRIAQVPIRPHVPYRVLLMPSARNRLWIFLSGSWQMMIMSDSSNDAVHELNYKINYVSINIVNHFNIRLHVYNKQNT
jgi:hypothetical protein